MKKVLLVGATSAIGGACARLWAKAGARMFLVARDGEKLESIASDLSIRGASRVHVFRMDVNDFGTHAAMLDAAVLALGEVDIALIAHGTLPDQSVCETDPAAALRAFSTNAVSVIALLTIVANHFERQRKGAIAVITSVAGERGRRSNYFYGSAKAAVSVFCDGLRARLSTVGVSLTDIRPGLIATPMTEGLRLPRLLVVSPSAIADRIVAGIKRKKEVVYVPAFWFFIMLVVRNVPRALLDRTRL